MLRDDAVILRAIEPEDLELMVLIENDMRLWDCTDTTVPYSTFVLREYIKHNTCNFYDDHEVRMTITLPQGGAVGFVDLRNYEPRHQRAEVGIVLIPEYQHLGLAQRAMHLLMDYASRVLHLHQVYAHVQVTNVPALHLFSKAGFQHTATLSQWTRCADGWCDVMVYQMFLEE